MTNSRADKFSLLDKHLATGTEASYTYTPNNPLDMKVRYRELIIIFTGSVTATLSLYMKLNENTNYDEAIQTLDTTTVSGQVLIDRTQIDLIDTGLLDVAATFQIEMHIYFNDAGDHLCGLTNGSSVHEGINFNHFEDQSTDTTITEIEFLTSTSTWATGTEISIYGLRR